nr:atrial natriuretic peptide-converting enzyme-like [Onthophagus taurus]
MVPPPHIPHSLDVLKCENDHFQCKYGACIKKSFRCNQKIDCLDGSDEINCNLTQIGLNDFLCLNQKVIPNSLICNNFDDCGDNSDENFSVCAPNLCDLNEFRCKSGNCVKNSLICDGFPDCFDGSDEFRSICDLFELRNTNSIKCSGLKLFGVDLKCKDEKNDCDFEQEIGTISEGGCKEFYEGVEKIDKSKAVCQFDGRWNSEHVKCKPICGTKSPALPLISSGFSIENWPWFVGLYSLETSETNFFCGGTLISEKIVLTAAHCVWKKSPEDILAVLGKYKVDLAINEPNSQQRNIEKIILHPNYYDIETNYASDISILYLKTFVNINEFIKPICIDWFNRFHKNVFDKNLMGTVVGMGLTENDTFASHLLATNLPIVTVKDCMINEKKDFHKYITSTTFCAGFLNGTGVCNGDSGGGLAIFNDGKWFLEGLVSISPRKSGKAVCDTNKYTIFTKISSFLDWIKEVVPPEMLF